MGKITFKILYTVNYNVYYLYIILFDETAAVRSGILVFHFIIICKL